MESAFGPDRITKTLYDNANQVTGKEVAVGTADAATEATLTYTNNGRLQTLKDAENNLTTYEYDGFDRLSKTRMPNPTQGSGTSSTTDYEQLTYDAASNVTNRRLRDGQNMTNYGDSLLNSTAVPARGKRRRSRPHHQDPRYQVPRQNLHRRQRHDRFPTLSNNRNAA